MALGCVSITMSTLTISPRAPGPEAMLSVYHGGALLRYVGCLAPELGRFLGSLRNCDLATFERVFAALAPVGSDPTHWLRNGDPVRGVLGALCLAALESASGRERLSRVSGVDSLPDLTNVHASTRRVCLLGAQYEKYRDPTYRALLLSARSAHLFATDAPEADWPVNELLPTVRSAVWREDALARQRSPAWLWLAPESGSLAHADLAGLKCVARPSVMRIQGACLVLYEDSASLGISADVAAQPEPDINELVSRFCVSAGLDPLTWTGAVCEDLSLKDCSRGCVLVRLGADEGDESPYTDLNLLHGEMLFVVRV